jgi:hypothetical protein
MALFAGVVSGMAAAPALEHREQSFSIHLNGSVAKATPFFGPVRESEWAPGWTPRFVHPSEGIQCEGAVFTTTNPDGKQRLWMLTAYDPSEGRVEYVVITAGLTANQIKIQVSRDGENRCQATITYRHTALSVAGNAEVAKLDPAWREQQRSHWENAINAALRTQEKK